MPIGAFLGSFCTFWLYNRYPARIFEGNIGALMFGSIIGCTIVVQEYWWFGFFILIPHSLNFILWIIWLVLMRKYPDIHLDKNSQHTKFGKVASNGILKVPSRLTLKWIPNYYFDLNEKQSTFVVIFITFVFCILGLLIFP